MRAAPARLGHKLAQFGIVSWQDGANLWCLLAAVNIVAAASFLALCNNETACVFNRFSHYLAHKYAVRLILGSCNYNFCNRDVYFEAFKERRHKWTIPKNAACGAGSLIVGLSGQPCRQLLLTIFEIFG